MMQITEDTPPDMLAGAMDLTVHLPTETTVKMSVDRSTPMMDLLVQITTAHHLQQSGHILQALEMAPSSGRLDKILPYKPNTPIGVLDTQHVKVIPKNRSIPIPKSVSGGHQPFESTFRLQVHLPRNQLYVIRVSQNVYLEDIMKKVCHEKNLDPSKFEFRHPANLDEVLNPKLTLSDYQITEVYVVFKGTIGLTQPFSANDIMASRKEEERKQMQARTGGGVLSLIFKRGKQSMGSGSISSENRSISPSHSDDSRSVTPPAIQQPLLSSRIQPATLLKEKPKAPQRKRRPAPKPPQSTDSKKDVTDKPPSEISSISESNTIDSKKLENGLTICHSRNSSDSSGYHEPSVLSDNCNTSLPRRSKSTLINEVLSEESQFEENVSVRSQNLSTMSNFSKSTSSIAGRKKKAAPPPPLISKSEDFSSSSETVTVSIAGSIVSDKTDNTETESAVAETVPKSIETESLDDIAVDVTKTSPVPMRRKKLIRAPPKPAPRVKSVTVDMPIPQARNPSISKEDKLQLDAEEIYNNMLKEAYPIDANKSINNGSSIQNNLTSKVDYLQLTDNDETNFLKPIKSGKKFVEDTSLIDFKIKESPASSSVNQEIFNDTEEKISINDNAMNDSSKNKEAVEINRLSIEDVKNNSDKKSNLAKYLPELIETETVNTNDESDIKIFEEIPAIEYDLLEMCDLALKEIEMLKGNLDNTNTKTNINDDLISLDVPNSNISNVDKISTGNNKPPVPKQRLRNKKSKITLNNNSPKINIVDKDLSSPNNDKINNDQSVNPASEVSQDFDDLISYIEKIGTNSKDSITRASPSIESIYENADDTDKGNNDQLFHVRSEVAKSSQGVICDSKSIGANDNESVTDAFLFLENIDLKEQISNDVKLNNQLVDVTLEVATSSEDVVTYNAKNETGSSKECSTDAHAALKNNYGNPPVIKKRVPKSGSLSSNLSSLDSNDNKLNNQLVDVTLEAATSSENVVTDNAKTETDSSKECSTDAFVAHKSNYGNPPVIKKRVSKSRSLSSNLSSLDFNDNKLNNQLVDITLEAATSSEDVVTDNAKTDTDNSKECSTDALAAHKSNYSDPPEIKKRISKSGSLSSNLSSLDSIGRASGLNIGSSLVKMSHEDIRSRNGDKHLDNISVTSKSSINTGSNADLDDFNMHTFEDSDLKHSSETNNDYLETLSSLKSSNSDENLHGEGSINEWNGTRKLSHISTDVNPGDSTTWIVGDHSDTESAEVHQRVIKSSNKSIDPIKRSSISSTTSLKSINSEVTQFEKSNEVVRANLNCDSVHNTAITPKNLTKLESSNSIINLNQNSKAEIHAENQINIKDVESQIILNCNPTSSVLIETPKMKEKSSTSEEAKNQAIVKANVEEFDDLDHEWQYQLPSPPKAFRDSSPTNSTQLTNYDTITLQDFKEHSILSHSELFEKLDQIKDGQYENESISDFSSVCNDEEKPILSKLTLENLEKRQSLVYNRELSTSLKNAQENNFTSQPIQTRSRDDTNIKRSSVVNELEKAIKSNKPLVRHNSCITDTTLKPFVDNNLPNFKISTYDTFKRKINIFEDESIRSNSDNTFKSITYNEMSNSKSMPYDSVNCFSNKSPMRSQNLSIAKSIENLSIVNIDCDEVDFKKPSEYSKHNSNSKNSFYVKHKSSTLNSAGRSESFSANKWIPQNPVQRSKSQVALNKFNEIEQDITYENPSPLTKSNSLFDVSGLQSLEVIRSIQNKLNTPNNSTEDLLGHKEEPKQSSARSSISLDHDSAPVVEKPPSETTTTKTYRYQGPPSINLSTWSERPKTKVSLKEDTDYKIKNAEKCNIRTPTTTTVELNSTQINGSAGNGTRRYSDTNSCTIQINGTEPIRTNQDSGNVTIKVGNNQFSKQFSRINKFMQNMENPFVRKPLGNINKIETNSRPHSLPQDSDFDISRVPIVRAVELKKSIKETSPVNTSVTQINALNNEITNNNKYADIYQSTERLQEINGLKNQTSKSSSVYLTSENTHKPIVRGNSFAYSRNVPKVMGFTDIKIENDNTPRSRKSWNVPSNYESLPLKIKPEPPVRSSSFLPNSNVPFSNLTLKRVESKKADLSANNNIYGNVVLRNTASQFKCEEINQDVPNNEKPKQFPTIRRISNGSNTVPPCPPPLKPIVPKKMVKRSESCADPRDELLSSIRNFGGQKGLRHVKAV